MSIEEKLVKPRRHFRMPWIIPLFGIFVIFYLSLYDAASKNIITITFESAEGIRPGVSKLQLNGVDVGRVRKLNSTPDLSHVVIEVEVPSRASYLFTEGAIFWIDKKASGIPQIAMLVPPTLGHAQLAFVGRQDPPILKANVPGHIFLLKAKRIGSISLGAPVFFRDLSVGLVLGWDIADLAEYVTIHAFVRAPFDSYVHDESQFWISEGVLNAKSDHDHMEGSRIPGIAFETPAIEFRAAVAAQNQVFPLFADRDAANSASYTRKILMKSYFSGSVRGLAPGSEVTLHGVKVGEVIDVRLAYDLDKDIIVAPVRYQLEPERIVGAERKTFVTDADAVMALLKKGLRATLESASPNTGQQNVALDFSRNAPPNELAMDGSDFVVPATEEPNSR